MMKSMVATSSSLLSTVEEKMAIGSYTPVAAATIKPMLHISSVAGRIANR